MHAGTISPHALPARHSSGPAYVSAMADGVPHKVHAGSGADRDRNSYNGGPKGSSVVVVDGGEGWVDGRRCTCECMCRVASNGGVVLPISGALSSGVLRCECVIYR